MDAYGGRTCADREPWREYRRLPSSENEHNILLALLRDAACRHCGATCGDGITAQKNGSAMSLEYERSHCSGLGKFQGARCSVVALVVAEPRRRPRVEPNEVGLFVRTVSHGHTEAIAKRSRLKMKIVDRLLCDDHVC